VLKGPNRLVTKGRTEDTYLYARRLEASRAAATNPGVRAAPPTKDAPAGWMTETSPTTSRRGKTNMVSSRAPGPRRGGDTQRVRGSEGGPRARRGGWIVRQPRSGRVGRVPGGQKRNEGPPARNGTRGNLTNTAQSKATKYKHAVHACCCVTRVWQLSAWWSRSATQP
jgi:hypothetical protein